MIYCDYGQGKDTVEAVKLFRASAEQGDKNGLEMLAKCYDFGWGVPVDKVEAAKWYEKSRK
jgi:TPR repeat protein